MATTHTATPRTDLEPRIPQIRKIAVLTDFSPAADNALQYAAMIARSYGAEILLAHAFLPPACASAAPTAAMVFAACDDRRQYLEERLRAKTRQPLLETIRCSIALCEGAPVDLVQELKDVDLVVVGTSGATGLRKAFLGSTAETVFHTVTKPVLTVGPSCATAEEGKSGAILCAVSLSGAADVLGYALSIAKRRNAELMLLHVVEGPGVVFALEQAHAKAEIMEELRRRMTESDTGGVRTTFLVGFGNADSVILNEARIHDARLIVVGTHRTRVPALASHFAGGTAYSVATNAECPVLTIPAKGRPHKNGSHVSGSTLHVTGITESKQHSETH